MTDESLHQIYSLSFRAARAIETLNASRRLVCAEHNERIRKLRDFTLSLAIQSEKKTDEMFDIESTISPELKRLLNDSTHSLNPSYQHGPHRLHAT